MRINPAAALALALSGCTCARGRPCCPTGAIERRTPASVPAPTVVAAKSYEFMQYEGPMDFVHGGGVRVHGIFIPSAKISARLSFEGWGHGSPRMTARYGDEPEVSQYPAREPRATPEALADLELPADLATHIEKVAEMRKRLDDEERALGEEIRKRLKWDPLPSREE